MPDKLNTDKWTRLETEQYLKRTVACSVFKITFNDSEATIRVVCDTGHGPVHLKALDEIQATFNARVNLIASTFGLAEPALVIVVQCSPAFYPRGGDMERVP